MAYHELDFFITLGREFCEVLEELEPDLEACGQDAYEVFADVLENPSPEALQSLTDSQVEQLRDTCEDFLELDGVTTAHIRAIVHRTLSQWTDND